MVQDPLAEKYYPFSAYNYCVNNPMMFVDPDGKAIETAWDLISLGAGLKSFRDNIRQGKIGAAIFDGLGVILDAAAVATPFVPGGVSAAIGAIRIANAADNLLDATRNVNRATEIGKQVSYTRSNFRKYLVKLTGIDPKDAQAHHIFPRKFENNFNNLGINIHEPQYGTWWETKDHQHFKNKYNDKWGEFFKDENNTKEDAFNKVKELAQEYGFELNILE